MLDYFQTLMEEMSFHFGAAGHTIGHFHLPPTAQDDSIQLLALLLPFCFGVHYYLPPLIIVLTPDITTWHAWYQVPWL